MASKQQEKSEQTRMELKESAYKLFLEKGYDGTTIAEITSNAGYSTGSFYRHWKEKEELFNLIQDEFLEKIITLIQQAISEITSQEQIVDLLVNIYFELTKDSATLRLFVESPQAIKPDKFMPKIRELLGFCTNILSAKINSLSQGQRNELSSYQISSLIYSFLGGYILLNSIGMEVSSIETLRSALLAVLKID